MNTTEHTANPAVTSSTGPLATLDALLHAEGTGMPKINQGSGAHGRVLNPIQGSGLSLVAFVLCVVAAVFTFASAPALAKTVHVYSESFGKAGAGAGELALGGTASGIAVNEETHNVYVADAGNHRVDEFSSGGVFIRAFGANVGGAGVDVCTSTCVAGSSESAPGAFEEPVFIAIDNDPLSFSHGDVYVGDRGDDLVTKFTAEGMLESAWGTDGQLNGSVAEDGPFGALDGIALNSSGDLFVYDENRHWFKFAPDGAAEPTVSIERGTSPVGIGVDGAGNFFKVLDYGVLQEFEPSGEELLEFFEPSGRPREYTLRGVTAFAVEHTTNDLYIVNEGSNEGSEVARVSGADALLERFGSGHLTRGAGVAVDATNQTVYVADSAAEDVAVFPDDVIPDVAVGSVSSFPSNTSATLTGTVGPDDTTVTGCEFEYGSKPGVFTGKAVCVPVTPYSGEAPVTVSATASGLTQGDTYYYRLSATNANGSDSSSEGTFLQPDTIVVESESASLVETGAATLEAKINPGGAETSYHFEYGPAAGDYDVSVPVPDGEIVAGLAGVEVSARAIGLVPSTTYHYRVVATNGLPGAVDGPDQTFTTLTPQGTGSPTNCPNEQARAEQPYGLGLPDCRAYEQVSPVNKEGGHVEHIQQSRAAVSGEAIMYFSQNSFSEPVGANWVNEYVSRRGPDGWSTQNITPPTRLSVETSLWEPYQQMIFTPELTKGLFLQRYSSLSSEVPAGYNDLYVADFAERSYELVNNVPPPGKPYSEEVGEDVPSASGGSVDFSHVAFTQKAALTPGASRNLAHAYEWVNGALYQVDVPPKGATFKGNGSTPVGTKSVSTHTVSEDGLRVVFTQEPEGEGSPQQVYVRENPEQPPVDGSECAVPTDACTIEVSASQRKTADSHGPQSASFQGASADGSRVFFTSNAELTDNANTGEEDNAANLYEYDFEKPEGERLTDLTVDTETDPVDVKDGAAVTMVINISEDGSYVYFVAEGKLAGNENASHATAESGKRNLYVYHEGKVTFIATLSANDLTDQEYEQDGSKVSGDGTHLAFISDRSLTGYDNKSVDEIYLFDASTGSLVCASCDPSGARPIGAAWFSGRGPRVSSTSDFAEASTYVSRNLSEDGSELFFNSPDPLVPQASNGLNNVYEYENGHVYLISDGAGAYESDFLDMGANGKNVFFATTDGLLPQDQDERADVYDARVDGGFPVAASVAPCDNGDSCRGPVSPQPAVFGAPGSATFSGAGNPPPPPPPPVKKVTKKTVKCKKGSVKNKKGKCVKNRKTAKRAKKSTHGKGSK